MNLDVERMAMQSSALVAGWHIWQQVRGLEAEFLPQRHGMG
jgi:hypothetical protein